MPGSGWMLLDGSFVELGRLAQSTQHRIRHGSEEVPGDGIIIGHGTIEAGAWYACVLPRRHGVGGIGGRLPRAQQ